MKNKIISQLVYYFIRLLNMTYRYEFVGLENKRRALEAPPNKTFVYAVWHRNLVSCILAHIGEKFTMIISESKDGELAAVTCQKLGYFPARGSSTRGGKKALAEMVKLVKSGIPGALTVDGPKGPARVVKPGVIEIARLAQCPVLPLSSYPERHWVFERSWDKFRLPKPFTRIVVVIGEPVYVDENVSREAFEDIALKVGNLINQGDEIAEAYFKN